MAFIDDLADGCFTCSATNPFWAAFEDTLTDLGYQVEKEIFPAGE